MAASDDRHPDEAAPVLDSGSVVDDRYRILEPLGRGGMGRVYRAEHTTLRRPVALKVLHRELAGSADMKQRFEREAFAAARLDHANCATAFDFGNLADGSHYFVAELLDGISLRDLLEQQTRLDVPRALHIARHVLRGLGHMHERGVIHRDIKPENVMLVERDGDPDFARILDFGIAKLIGEAEADAAEAGSKLTSAGTAIGTPTYIAPEQAMGGEIDGRVDLYAVTVMLFEMIAGRPPFSASDAVQLIMKQATAAPPTLSSTIVGASFSPQLEELVGRGLAKSRDDRFPDAGAYVAAIGPVLAIEANRPLQQPTPEAHASTMAVQTPVPADREPRAAVPFAATTPVPITTTPVPHQTGPAQAATAAPSPAHDWARQANQVLTQLPPGATPVPAPLRPLRPWHGAFWRYWRHWGGAQWAAAVGVILVPIVLLAATCGSGGSYDDLVERLRKGESCQERLSAVRSLRRLGDPRAIPHLKRARHRMRGGVAGIGDHNTNDCLKDEATAAIRELSKK